MKKLNIIVLLTALLLLMLSTGRMQAKDVEGKSGNKKFSKFQQIPNPALQRAIGFLEKGKLKTTTWNYGVFTGSNFSDNPYPEGLWGDYMYIPTIALLFGVEGRDENGNPQPWATGKKYLYSREVNDYVWQGKDTTYWGPTVSESYMDRTSGQILIDWEAVSYAQDSLHGEATAGEVFGGLWARPDDQTPLMATSDITQSWPIRIDPATGDEESFWPGPWALTTEIDTATGDTILVEDKGVFVSDQDVYFEFDDRLASRDVDPPGIFQGYPIGVKALVSAYSYGASVAEDIIFFNMKLVNISDKLGLNGGQGYNYTGAYGGFWFDVDSYHRTRDGSTGGRTNDDDMMSFNIDHNFGYIWDLDDNSSGATNLAYSALKLLETPRATKPISIETEFGTKDIAEGEQLGLTDWHWVDWYFRPMADDGGPQGPFTGDGEQPNASDGEAVLYKIMSGDTSTVDMDPERVGYNREHYFHEAPGGILYPHFDSFGSLKQDYPEGLDCVFIMSSGPFDFAVGDTIPFSFAIIMGQDSSDLVTNAKIAQLMYDNNYRGPTPPKAPNVSVLEGDREVTLFWDDVSLNSEDALTKIEDFEGFRIYKSTDNGRTWGEQRFDDSTGVSYWKPIAQFDLDNQIRGHDPTAPHRFLGNNSGLKFQFTDTDVNNGQEYLYAVSAYDRGFIGNDPKGLRDSLNVTNGRFTFRSYSLENFLSNNERNASHIVRAIPHRSPANVEQAEVQISKIDSTRGNGQFDIQVVDTKLLTGDEYMILFHADMSTGVPRDPTYDLINLTTGDTLLKTSKNFINLDPTAKFKTIPPRIDGLEWIIKSATSIIVDPSEDAVHWEGQCNYDVSPDFSQKAVGDYIVVFKGEGTDNAYNVLDTSAVAFPVPFEIWNQRSFEGNKIVPRKGKVTVYDLPPTGEWNSGDQFYLYENHLSGFDPEYTQRTLRLTFTWRDTAYYDSTLKRTFPAHRKWAVGDTLFIPVLVPFHEGDGYIVNTQKIYKVNQTTESDLKEIKVVPNPYIVRAGWEFDEFTHKLQFTNLPSKCSIYIFNVAGELIQTLKHDDPYDGSENWNLWTTNRQEVAPGLYIWVVETPDGKKEMGKFTIIR